MTASFFVRRFRRLLRKLTVPVAVLAVTLTTPALAEWRDSIKQLRLGTAASEVDQDTIKAYEMLAVYLTKKFGIPTKVQQATDYAAITEALRSDNIEFTRMGGANYALAHRLMGDGVEPVIVDLVKGGRGYHAVVLVQADSSYQKIEDLKGKTLAFVDPNSSSGYAAPNFFLTQQGFEPKKYFGSVVFAGSHDNSVIGLVNRQFDAASTYEFTEDNSSVTRLAQRGMIDATKVRKIWKSPLLANPMWATRTNLPKDLREEFATVMVGIKDDAPKLWELLRQGRLSGYGRSNHKEYIPMIEMTEWNRKQRKKN